MSQACRHELAAEEGSRQCTDALGDCTRASVRNWLAVRTLNCGIHVCACACVCMLHAQKCLRMCVRARVCVYARACVVCACAYGHARACVCDKQASLQFQDPQASSLLDAGFSCTKWEMHLPEEPSVQAKRNTARFAAYDIPGPGA